MIKSHSSDQLIRVSWRTPWLKMVILITNYKTYDYFSWALIKWRRIFYVDFNFAITWNVLWHYNQGDTSFNRFLQSTTAAIFHTFNFSHIYNSLENWKQCQLVEMQLLRCLFNTFFDIDSKSSWPKCTNLLIIYLPNPIFKFTVHSA